MKRILLVFLSVLTLTACGDKVDVEALQEEVKENRVLVQELKSQNLTLNSKIKAKEAEIEKLQQQLEEAAPYFAMTDAEKEVIKQKEIEAKAEAERLEEERKAKEEAEAKAKAEAAEAERKAQEEAEAKRKQEEEEAKAKAEAEKYKTGLTYDDLARNPDSHLLKLITFKGKIIQVMNGAGYTQYRMAVNSDYDKVILIEIDNSLLTNGKILEDDSIEIRGQFIGDYEYTTVLGSSLTVPAIVVDEYDMK